MDTNENATDDDGGAKAAWWALPRDVRMRIRRNSAWLDQFGGDPEPDYEMIMQDRLEARDGGGW